MAEVTMGFIFIMFILFLISVAIMRWAFRVNDIVKRLDKLIELQGGDKTDIKPTSFVDGIRKGMKG